MAKKQLIDREKNYVFFVAAILTFMRPLTDRNRRVISFSQFLFTTKKEKHHHSLSRSTDRIILLMFALTHYYYYYHFLFLFFIKVKYIVIDYLSSTSYLHKKKTSFSGFRKLQWKMKMFVFAMLVFWKSGEQFYDQ